MLTIGSSELRGRFTTSGDDGYLWDARIERRQHLGGQLGAWSPQSGFMFRPEVASMSARHGGNPKQWEHMFEEDDEEMKQKDGMNG